MFCIIKKRQAEKNGIAFFCMHGIIHFSNEENLQLIGQLRIVLRKLKLIVEFREHSFQIGPCVDWGI